ncbi:MAG TPA: ATP-binding cassette domain-containing protein [Chitinophagaceae bacterium]|jgi:phospholipid/cholesterol/gamma-HCH transport system ATP-binding protein|nr:ATP-binding cassette domain-containing protein [Chitinophagaceae bacterium]
MKRQDDNKNKKEPIVSIRNVYKSFEDNNVLNGVDLELYKEENIVVMGRSGSGKSVLIKIIIGLMKPGKGEVKILGKEVHKLNKQELIELRLKIGFLFQHNALYDSMTVRENIEFPLTRNKRNISQEEINKAVDDVLDAVGLTDTADQFPAELSGGQEKRIAIARTLILKPELILYDEPTAGLDPITSVEINELIKDVKEKYKTSSIIITHDLVCAKQTGDKIFMLVDGKFVRHGGFEEVFETDDERIKGFYDYNFIQ